VKIEEFKQLNLRTLRLLSFNFCVHLPTNLRCSYHSFLSIHSSIEEIKTLREFKHCPNILKFYGYIWHDYNTFIFTEWYDFDLDMLHYNFRSFEFKFPDYLLRRILLIVIETLNYLHAHEILHGNIQPSSIVFQKNGLIKIRDLSYINEPDFSSTLKVDDPDFFIFKKQCKFYQPPKRIYSFITGLFEKYRGIPLKEKLYNDYDIWALGLTIINITTMNLNRFHVCFKLFNKRPDLPVQ
jgi:serine/threonine protein kinase